MLSLSNMREGGVYLLPDGERLIAVADHRGGFLLYAPKVWKRFHGWGPAEPWLPWPPEPDRRNAAVLRADESSILHLYRRLLATRRASPALQTGTWAPLPSPSGALAYERVAGDDRRTVLVNFEDHEVGISVAGMWGVEVSSDGAGEGRPYAGRLDPDQAVVLRPLRP